MGSCLVRAVPSRCRAVCTTLGSHAIFAWAPYAFHSRSLVRLQLYCCGRNRAKHVRRLGGTTYLDVLHVYGIARAGYIPQLFSLRLPSPDVVYELLHLAGAQALVFDPAFASIVVNCPIPAELSVDVRSVDVSDAVLPPLWVPSHGDEIIMIYHTSGSTSGSPKLVPCTADWVNATVQKAAHVTRPRSSDRQDVTVWM